MATKKSFWSEADVALLREHYSTTPMPGLIALLSQG